MELSIQPFATNPVAFNRAEMTAAIAAIAERYAGVVAADKAAAKRDRAEINRILKQIDDARKTVKKQYEAPLKAFENELKEIVEPLKAAGAAIDAQVKEWEEAERAERMTAIEEAFAELGERPYPLARILDNTWLNASTSLKSATNALQAAAERLDADIAAVKGIHTPHTAALLAMLMDDPDATLADVLAYNNDLTTSAQVFAIDVAETPQEAVERLTAEEPLNDIRINEDGLIEVAAKVSTRTLTVSCSDASLERITAFLDSLRIFYLID